PDVPILSLHDALPICGRIDAGDPQAPELALAVAPVPVRIHQRLEHLLVGRAVRLALAAPVALGQLQDFLMAAPGNDAPLYPRHLYRTSPKKRGKALRVGQKLPDTALLGWAQHGRLAKATLAPRRLVLQQMAAKGAVLHELAAASPLEALSRAPVGLELRHRSSSSQLRRLRSLRGSLHLGLLLLLGRQDHDHLTPLKPRRALDQRDALQLVGQIHELVAGQVRMDDFTVPEPHRDLDLVPIAQEPLRVAQFDLEIVGVNL